MINRTMSKMDTLIHPSNPYFFKLPITQHFAKSLPRSLTSTIPPYYVHTLVTALTLVLPILLILYIHKDYKRFLSLGPGGTPSTPSGYARIKLLSLICLRDPLRPIPIPPHFRPQAGYISSLPPREGERPLIEGIAPQRQQTARSPPHVYKKLVSQLRALAQSPDNLLDERTSCFEKHSSGLFSRAPITRTCGGEICHVHPSDGSLHLTLHPADIGALIASGRGERHPLARGGWCRRFVPREFVLVYAPRDEGEVEMVMKVVRASIWWVSGMDVAEGRGAKGDEWARGQREVEEGEEIRKKREEEKMCWACRKKASAGKKDEMVGTA